MGIRIDPSRGLILTVALFVLLRLSEIVLSYMAGVGLAITTPRELAIGIGLNSLVLCLLVGTIKALGKVDIGRLFWGWPPQAGESLKWACIGVILSIPGFIHASGLPTYFGHEGYVTFCVLNVVRLAVLLPCIEETLFRGVCFSSLLDAGRIKAYAISTVLFLLWHVKSVDVVVRGTAGLTWSHALIVLGFGLVSAYIYERTRKLSLCIIFHGTGNAFLASAPFVTYLLQQLKGT